MLLVKHFRSRGHFSLFMQLQFLSLLLLGGSRTVLLCLLMIDFSYSRALLPLFIYKIEKVNFKYSERAYLLQVMEKIEMFITRMHWKVIYCNNKANYNSRERYGLKTLKCPKQVKELVPFENDLIDMLKVIKFRKVKNQFLTKLKNNIKTGKQSKKTLTFTDKTSNMYRLSKEQHELLTNAVTSNYKKANNSIKKKINMAGKQILKNSEILNRIEIN